MLAKWKRHMHIDKTVERSLSFLLVMVSLAHIMACLWFYSSNLLLFNEDTWVYQYIVVEDRAMTENPVCWTDNTEWMSVLQWYWAALYWAITTVTTVGFGDITPHNDNERLVASLSMVIGGGAYAYIVGNITAMMQEFDPQERMLQSKISDVNYHMVKRNVPHSLRFDIREHYTYFWKHNRLVIDEEAMLAELSPALQRKVTEYLNKSVIKNIPFCSTVSDTLIASLPRLQPLTVPTMDVVVREGEPFEGLYYLSSGRVALTKDTHSLSVLSEGSVFGEIALFIEPHIHIVTATAAEPLELFFVPHDVLKRIFDEHPDVGANMLELARARHAHLTTGKKVRLQVPDVVKSSVEVQRSFVRAATSRNVLLQSDSSSHRASLRLATPTPTPPLPSVPVTPNTEELLTIESEIHQNSKDFVDLSEQLRSLRSLVETRIRL